MSKALIALDHFTGQRNITPTPDTTQSDLARLIREQQQDAKGRRTIDDTDTPYDALVDDVIVGVDTTSAVVTVNLPLAASVPEGKMITIQDEGGNAGANAITVAKTGSDTLAGASTIGANYGRVSAYSNGVDTWYCA